MSIFYLRQSMIDEYNKYIQSFLSIADERVRAFFEESILEIPRPSGFRVRLSCKCKERWRKGVIQYD